METTDELLEPGATVVVKYNPHIRRYKVWIEDGENRRWVDAMWDLGGWGIGDFQTRWKWLAERVAHKMRRKLDKSRLKADRHFVNSVSK